MLLLLLDADVIIDLHRLGVWKTIAQKHEIYIPSIVLRKEAYRYENTSGSFENLLNKSGITKGIEPKHTEKYFKLWLTEGSIMKIQERGLKKEK